MGEVAVCTIMRWGVPTHTRVTVDLKNACCSAAEGEKCVSEGVEGKSLNSRFKCYMNQKEKQLYEEC